MMASVGVVVVFLSVLSLGGCTNGGFPNSLGSTPPMSWRSWNTGIGAGRINQTWVQRQVDALVKSVDGQPSLLELGYGSVEVDDGWEACGSGVNGGYHSPSGVPLVNETAFPDLDGLVAYAKDRGVGIGWYLNCDGCHEHGVGPFYDTDAKFIAQHGFDSIKFDAGGVSHNITAYAVAINATGRAVRIENCNDADPRFPTADGFCPYNLFRTGSDNAPTVETVMWQVMQAAPLLHQSRPGCFAYLDMLELYGSPAVESETKCKSGRWMTLDESRLEFAVWCTLSSPLTLGFDLTDSTVYSALYPIISNKRALGVNQAWAGSAGAVVAQSATNFTGEVQIGRLCEATINRTIPYWVVLAKPLTTGFAVTAFTWGPNPVPIAVDLATIGFPGSVTSVDVLDVWSGEPVPGGFNNTIWQPTLPAGGSVFVLMTPK